jgi:two-component system NtrC family sensor kinase
MKRRIRYIGTRLIASAAVMTALLVGALSIVTFTMHRDDLMDHVTMHANQLSDIVQRSLYYSMLRYDRENITETISQIGREEGIEIARIFNKSGEIIYSSVPADVGIVVDIGEEGCIECHAAEVPLVELRHGERSRIIGGAGNRSLRVVTPIYNEPACASADCHPSPQEQNVLGVLYMAVGLRGIDQQLKHSATFVAAFTAIIIIVLSIFLAYFVRRFIRRPVMALRQGVQRVAAGDLDHQIPVESRTEIGELASSFNQMTVDLKKARGEIEEWGHNLEHRVRERTAELAETQAQLLQSEKLSSLGKLAASVAHEINNPLMGILTFIRIFQDWIKGGEFPPKKHAEFSRDLDIMGKETTRISKIVRNLLAFARRSRLEKREHQINELLKQCVELLDHQLSLQEIDIVLDLAPDLPQLYVDGGQIQQALMNLLLNAAEAMGKDGTLTLKSALVNTGRTISIKVADTGPGIPEGIMDKLFDPFFTTKEEGKGTGLGLPVTYGIIHKHGGSIKVRSKPGDGAEFEILLPTTRDEAQDMDAEVEGPEVS